MAFNVTIYATDPKRMIAGIKFVRAVTQGRDGRALGLRESKNAVDDLRDGIIPRIEIIGVPDHVHGLVQLAAASNGVELSDTKGSTPLII